MNNHYTKEFCFSTKDKFIRIRREETIFDKVDFVKNVVESDFDNFFHSCELTLVDNEMKEIIVEVWTDSNTVISIEILI